jgi:tetratricopeptide (TPR) repeat protein
VVAGTFQRAGDALRMTARLVEVATASELWSEKLDGTLDTVLEMQDDLSARIAESLGVIVPEAPAGRVAHELDAFEHYQRALGLWGKFERRSVDDMTAHLARAIELEPNYAEALALMAFAHAPSRWIQSTDPADLERCIEFATRAIQVDPDVASAHVALGYAYWRSGRIEEAIEEEATAARLDRSSLGNYFLGACHIELGEYEPAVGEYEPAVTALQAYHELSRTPYNLGLLGFAHMQLEHRAEARWALREGYLLELDPKSFGWQGCLVGLAEQKRREGDLEAARADVMEALGWVERSDNVFRSPIRIQTLITLGRICRDQGDVLAAKAAFDQAISASGATHRSVGMGHFRVQALAGRSAVNGERKDLDAAIELFEKRGSMNFGFVALGCDVVTACDLAHASDALGDRDGCQEYRERSRMLGMPERLLP